MNRKLQVTAEVQDGDSFQSISCTGRDAWALLHLIKEGPKGCTPINNPGPRWSAYVFNLRQMGLAIQTIDERHSGPFPGTHARYVLQNRVQVTDSSIDLEGI